MKKKLFYIIYAIWFNLCARLLPQKKNRAAFVSMHNESFNDSLGAVRDEFIRRREYEVIDITRKDLDMKSSGLFGAIRFFFIDSARLAVSGFVFFNDSFLPSSRMSFKKSAVVVQLWHAEGAFKRFGLSSETDPFLKKTLAAADSRLTFAVCSSKNVVPIYAEAFGIDEKKVLPLGAPRADYFFTKGNEEAAKKEIVSRYPELKGKKLVLVAPTFRENERSNKAIFSHYDFEELGSSLGGEYAFLVRCHPQIRSDAARPGALDVSDYDDVRKLVLACDALITDYSSICMDFSLLGKKTVFFPFDLADYEKERSFYFDYEAYVPGRTVHSMKETADALRAECNKKKNESFRSFNFDFFDSDSAKRVADAAVSASQTG